MKHKFYFILFILCYSLNSFSLEIKEGAEGLLVEDYKEGFIILAQPTKQIELPPFVLFIRPVSEDFEIIATGKVEAIQENRTLVALNRESIIKFPLKGDIAIPMGSPKDWPPNEEPKVLKAAKDFLSEIPYNEPGFIQYDVGLNSGKSVSLSSDDYSNEFRDIPNYKASYSHFIWYIEFIWQLGIEYEKFDSSFPTSTYYRNYGDSYEKTELFTLNWRLKPFAFKNKLRGTLKLISLSKIFKTLNPDEFLINSMLSASGVGFRMSYELDSVVWSIPDKTRLKFQQLYLDFNYYPDVKANDFDKVKRGTSSPNSNINEWRFGFTTLVNFHFIPWIKRYVFELYYLERSVKINFSGPTKSETGGYFIIPEKGTSEEKSDWVFISFGIRFDDYIGKFLSPR